MISDLLPASSSSGPAGRLSLRIHPGNPDHHLFNNHGTWWVHYTLHPTPVTSERVRRNLYTTCRATARARRDALFARAAAHRSASHPEAGSAPRHRPVGPPLSHPSC